ncbi:hypothetical protein B0H16DRAFT_1724865 [Mycena metata]|uniref:Uncharacterized protein n=1 Tax=Mycena metata TaxID=1033252 RepID=A0AAD7N8E7_9AGAR|nr:hypothetical protein B0H16DRAFT_1724865 [Mycena metata]
MLQQRHRCFLSAWARLFIPESRLPSGSVTSSGHRLVTYSTPPLVLRQLDDADTMDSTGTYNVNDNATNVLDAQGARMPMLRAYFRKHNVRQQRWGGQALLSDQDGANELTMRTLISLHASIRLASAPISASTTNASASNNFNGEDEFSCECRSRSGGNEVKRERAEGAMCPSNPAGASTRYKGAAHRTEPSIQHCTTGREHGGEGDNLRRMCWRTRTEGWEKAESREGGDIATEEPNRPGDFTTLQLLTADGGVEFNSTD